MKNLDQIRAGNAIRHRDAAVSGKEGGEVVKKVPTMIVGNGLLAAAAFAEEQKADSGYRKVFEDCILPHLKTRQVGLNVPAQDLRSFIEYLSASDSATLRAVTAETIAFLNYLRRFVKKDKEEQ